MTPDESRRATRRTLTEVLAELALAETLYDVDSGASPERAAVAALLNSWNIRIAGLDTPAAIEWFEEAAPTFLIGYVGTHSDVIHRLWDDVCLGEGIVAGSTRYDLLAWRDTLRESREVGYTQEVSV